MCVSRHRADPTFLTLGVFPCDSEVFDACSDSGGFLACGFSCASCPICAEPEPIEEIQVIMQYGVVGDIFVLYVTSEEIEIAGLQAQVFCTVDGKQQGGTSQVKEGR